MRKPIKYLLHFEEFETKGFIKTPGESDLLVQLRWRYGKYLKIFNAGHNISIGRTGAKYGSYDIFGSKLCYYYDKRREKDFINFLVEKFFEKNPDADSDIRKVFTRVLHSHGLCWFGCVHGKLRAFRHKDSDVKYDWI